MKTTSFHILRFHVIYPINDHTDFPKSILSQIQMWNFEIITDFSRVQDLSNRLQVTLECCIKPYPCIILMYKYAVSVFFVCIFPFILFWILLLLIIAPSLLLEWVCLLRSNISPSRCRMEAIQHYRDILTFQRDRRSHLQNQNVCVMLSSSFSVGGWIQSISMQLLSTEDTTVPVKLICKAVMGSQRTYTRPSKDDLYLRNV